MNPIDFYESVVERNFTYYYDEFFSTGASAGIGEACAKEFAKAGSNLVNLPFHVIQVM